jgi:hypothetical protein
MLILTFKDNQTIQAIRNLGPLLNTILDPILEAISDPTLETILDPIPEVIL